MIWLLHTRRVSCITAEQAQTLGFTVPRIGAAKPTMMEPDGKILDLRCAGVGDMDATVWCCMDCINNLCRKEKEISMPPPALANLLWLGREHPLCQKASVGARMLSCLDRPVWRKLILGKGDKDELEKGIGGNCILLAQSRPHDFAPSLPPTIQELQESVSLNSVAQQR